MPCENWPTSGPSRTTRPRKSSEATSNGRTVSSAAGADGAREGISMWGLLVGSVMMCSVIAVM